MRKAYLDNIKWFTVVLVVIYHVFYMYNGVHILGGVGQITSLTTQYYDVILYLLHPWFMLLLFIVSGMTARIYLEHHTEKEFRQSRTTKLLIPSTVGLFVFQFIQGYLNVSMGGGAVLAQVPLPVKYLICVLSGQGVLWYIQTLWLFSMLLVLLRKVEKDRLWNLGSKGKLPALVLLTILVWISSLVLNVPVVSVYRFGYYGIGFCLGYFVLSHEDVMEEVKKYFVLFTIAALLLGAAFAWKNFGQNYAEAPVNRTLLHAAFGWTMSLAMLGGFERFFDFETDFTRWMTRRSFGLYVFHYMGISLVALYLGHPLLVPAWAAYVLSSIAGFGLGYLLNACISRIPFLRWAVLGMASRKGKTVETKS